MMKSFLKVATTVFMTVSAFVVADCSTTFEAGVGYRRDDINFNRGSSSSSSHDCSSDGDAFVGHAKSRFKDLNIFLINAKARSQDDYYYFRLSGDYGWITDGKVDHHFAIDPLALETRTHHKVNGNFVADVSVAIGYPFLFGCCNEWSVNPLIGYGWSTIKIDTKRHNGSSSCESDDLDVITCNPKHRFSFYSPYIGADVFYNLDDCWKLYGEFEYHFCGEAKRKVSGLSSCFPVVAGSDEVDFSRDNKSKHAQGFVGEIGANYAFACDWYAGLSVDYKYWNSKSGGNRLKWTSWGINANLGYVF